VSVLGASENQSAAMPTLVLLLIGAGTIFGFGVAMAVMRRANSDYKKTKAVLPAMRKDFWAAWWAMIKLGFWVVLGFLVLTAWAVHDVRDAGPAPAATISPSRSHR
jgi:hypothetical protein